MALQQKVPLADSLNAIAARAVQTALEQRGQSLPCTVVEDLGQTVTVSFEVDNPPLTLPQVTVPVLMSQYVRVPTPAGTKGVCVAMDGYIGVVTGLGTPSAADLTVRSNLSQLVFVPVTNTGWTSVDPTAVVSTDTTGTTKVTVSATGLTQEAQGPVTTTSQTVVTTTGTDVNILSFGGAALALSAAAAALSFGGHTLGISASGITADGQPLPPPALNIGNLEILANISGAVAPATGEPLTNVFDACLGNQRGDLIFRGQSNWGIQPLGPNGSFLGSNGVDLGWHDILYTNLPNIANLEILSNISGVSSSPSQNTLTSILDASFGSVRGSLLWRGSTSWGAFPPGTAGYLLVTEGAGADPQWQPLSSLGVTSVTGTSGVTASPTTGAVTVSLSATTNNEILANISGTTAPPAPNSMTAILNSAMGNARGDILYRGTSNWAALGLGTNGYLLGSNGTDVGYYNLFAQTISSAPIANSSAWEFDASPTYTGGGTTENKTFYVTKTVGANVQDFEISLMGYLTSYNNTGQFNCALVGKSIAYGTVGTYGAILEAYGNVSGSNVTGVNVLCSRNPASGLAIGIDIGPQTGGGTGTLDVGMFLPTEAVQGICGSTGGATTGHSLDSTSYGFKSNASYNFAGTNLFDVTPVPGFAPFDFYTTMYTNGNTASSSHREAAGIFAMQNSTGGPDVSNATDKTCLATYIEFMPASGGNNPSDGWAFYPVALLDYGSMSTYGYSAFIMECDMNNNTGVDMSSPVSIGGHTAQAYGVAITGNSSGTHGKPCTAALWLTGFGTAAGTGRAQWSKGIWLTGSTSIGDYGYLDQTTGSYAAMNFLGGYTYGLIMNSATFAAGGSQIIGVGFNIDLTGVYNHTSDGTLKNNVQPLTTGMPEIRKLRPVSFTWNDKATWATGQQGRGFIAQELAQVYPHLVRKIEDPRMPDQPLSVNLSGLVPELVAAIQELDARVQSIETKH